MKKFFKCIFAGIVISLCLLSSVFAATDYYELDGVKKQLPVASIYIDGKEYTGSSGVRPLVIDNRMYIAATDLTYIADATVGWDPATESISINSSKGSISYNKGGTSYILNGEKRSLGGNTKFYVVNKKSMIPVSIIPTFSNATIAYDSVKNATTITKGSSVHDDLFFSQEGPAIDETPIEGPTTMPKPTIPGTLPTVETVANCTASIQKSENGKEIVNIATGKFVEYETLYLQNPSRVAVDIKGYNATVFNSEAVAGSEFVKNVNSYFHADAGKYRITFNLKDGISTGDVSVQSTTDGFNIIYIKPAKAYKYASDRVNSELTLVLDKSVSINPQPIGENSLLLTIPKDKITMNLGLLSYTDRILTSIETVDSGDNYLSTITFKERVSYVMTSDGRSGIINLKFTKANNSVPTIVIDAGHGGKDPGAINKSFGVDEKSLNLTAASNLSNKLRQAGYNVVEVRNADYFVELKERANMANKGDADLFISIHHNSGSSTASGIETLYYPSEDNRAFADIVQKNLISATGAIDRKIQKRPNLVVLNSTKMPAALLELGFISNINEATRLVNQEYLNQMTDSVVKSVNEYFRR